MWAPSWVTYKYSVLHPREISFYCTQPKNHHHILQHDCSSSKPLEFVFVLHAFQHLLRVMFENFPSVLVYVKGHQKKKWSRKEKLISWDRYGHHSALQAATHAQQPRTATRGLQWCVSHTSVISKAALEIFQGESMGRNHLLKNLSYHHCWRGVIFISVMVKVPSDG